MKLCILFPGIGYHCGKPLLQRAALLAESKGYTVNALNYTDFPEGAKGSEDKMRLAVSHAVEQTEQQLKDTDFAAYDEIIFVGKSIGTAACITYREAHGIKARCLLLTPLELTFEHSTDDCTAFHGTADQWAETAEIERLCSECGVKLYEYPDANHSLMTADPQRNEVILEDVISKLSRLI